MKLKYQDVPVESITSIQDNVQAFGGIIEDMNLGFETPFTEAQIIKAQDALEVKLTEMGEELVKALTTLDVISNIIYNNAPALLEITKEDFINAANTSMKETA